MTLERCRIAAVLVQPVMPESAAKLLICWGKRRRAGLHPRWHPACARHLTARTHQVFSPLRTPAPLVSQVDSLDIT